MSKDRKGNDIAGPVAYPDDWATDAGAEVTNPLAAKYGEGWLDGERPPHEYMNALFRSAIWAAKSVLPFYDTTGESSNDEHFWLFADIDLSANADESDGPTSSVTANLFRLLRNTGSGISRVAQEVAALKTSTLVAASEAVEVVRSDGGTAAWGDMIVRTLRAHEGVRSPNVPALVGKITITRDGGGTVAGVSFDGYERSGFVAENISTGAGFYYINVNSTECAVLVSKKSPNIGGRAGAYFQTGTVSSGPGDGSIVIPFASGDDETEEMYIAIYDLTA